MSYCISWENNNNELINRQTVTTDDLNKFFIQDYNDLRKKPISVENEILIEDNIEFLREQDIEDVFERAYDKILLTSLKENKNDRLDDIKEIIDSDNINYINKELEFKYDI